MVSPRKIFLIIFTALLPVSGLIAHEANVQRDEQGLEVLKKMSAYMASLDQFSIKGVAFSDARLDAGLLVSNSSQIRLTVDRPGLMRITSFDGVDQKDVYFSEGKLTVYSSEKNFYGQADIPNKIEAAVEYALEELDVEAPLMDLVYQDVSTHLLSSDDSILYLSGSSQVAGVSCHHLVIRGPEIDLQLWIEKGEQPVLRKLTMTSKWEGGSPRFTANLAWDTAPKINSQDFRFTVPEGAIDIGFAQQAIDE